MHINSTKDVPLMEVTPGQRKGTIWYYFIYLFSESEGG